MTFSIKKLSESLQKLSDKQSAEASVAVLVRVENEAPIVFFVERVKNPSDPWSGQIAFPGGKREATDKDLMGTVIRETLEETGINLLKDCRFLGIMPPVQSKTRSLMRVLPFVFLIEKKPSVRLNEKELEEYFWIPLRKLKNKSRPTKFGAVEFPAFVIGSIIIWGLTYRIVESLIHRFETRASLRNQQI